MRQTRIGGVAGWMMLPVAIFGLASVVQAQAKGSTESPVATAQGNFVIAGGGCPVRFSAQRQASGGAMRISGGANPSEPGSMAATGDAPGPQRGAGVHILLTALRPVSSIRVEVRFRRLVPGVERAGSFTAGADESKVVRIQLRQGSERADLSRTIVIGPSTSTRRVHLLDIEYADGSRWDAPDANSCTVVPSPLMLVAER